MDTLGERLVFLRQQLGITAKEAEGRINITNLGRFEKNERKPSLDTLIDIANFYGVSTDWLLNGNDDRTPSPIPKSGEVVLLAKGYGGKTEIITLSEEDFEASKPLLERMRREYEAERIKPKRRKSKKG